MSSHKEVVIQEKWPATLAIWLLVITLLPLSYPFYILGKIPICLAAAYYARKNYRGHGNQTNVFWYFIILAIIYNPLIPLHLFFSLLWIAVDIGAIIYFVKYRKTI